MVVTAPMSNATSATSVTTTTPAITLSRNWARSSRLSSARAREARLCLIGTRLAFIWAGLLAGARQAQAVADGALGADQLRSVAGQLAPQVGDVGRHDRAGSAEVIVPYVVKERGAGEHPAGVEHEVAQQPELGRRQLDQAPTAADLVGFLVEREVRERQDRLGRGGAGGGQRGGAPGGQLLQPERLGHVVVAADGEPGDLVVLGVLRGQEDHRDPVSVPAQPADYLEPVDVGQHHVQDEQVEGAVPGEAERVRSVLRGGHLEAEEAQRSGDGLSQEELVVYHEQVPVVGWHHVIAAYGDERCVRETCQFRVNACPGPRTWVDTELTQRSCSFCRTAVEGEARTRVQVCSGFFRSPGRHPMQRRIS